jgi:molybdate transport system substrate-binding protein
VSGGVLARTTAAVGALAAALAGCGPGDDGAPTDGPDLTGELTVLAAASLTGSFTELAEGFEARHPGSRVTLAFDSSATLAEQVVQGAPADVLATADERTMGLVVDAGATSGDPRVFATNRLALVVPHGNPAGIEDVRDLADPAVDYVVCVRAAPCGALTADLLAEVAVSAPPASEEVDVKSVLTKVAADEADAGIVYETDARAAAGEVSRIPLPRSPDRVNQYLVAPLASDEPDLARAWQELLLSDAGQDVLRAAGFGAP